MRRIANREEVVKYLEAPLKLISSMEQFAGDGSFRQWKNKVTAATTFSSEILISALCLIIFRLAVSTRVGQEVGEKGEETLP